MYYNKKILYDKKRNILHVILLHVCEISNNFTFAESRITENLDREDSSMVDRPPNEP